MLRRVKVDKNIERKITIAFITSTSFNKKIRTTYKKEYIELDYAKKVIDWSLQYFDQYSESPGIHIQDIFDIEKPSLKEPVADLIELFLSDISEEYEKSEQLNVDYLVDQSKEYFRKRALEILFSSGYKLTSSGRILEAEKLLVNHKQVSKITSGRFDPFTSQSIIDYGFTINENELFRFPGDLGDLLGWFERGWFVAVHAPEKRGKSFMLEEITFAALTARLKVFWVSLEMNKAQLQKRIYQKMTGQDILKGREDAIPVLDCMNNQDDSCLMKRRKCSCAMPTEPDKNSNYIPCTICKGKSDKYIPAIYSLPIRTTEIKIKNIRDKTKTFTKMYGSNLRLKAFPRFSASIYDIINELNDLEYSESFLPDVVIIDYLDILAYPSGAYKSERDFINTTWKTAAQIAGERNCIVFTADQADAPSRFKRTLDQSSFSEDKRKDAHLDMRIAINQSFEEKEKNVARITNLFHRHSYFNPEKEVLILQKLSLGQPLLDSVWWKKEFEQKKEE